MSLNLIPQQRKDTNKFLQQCIGALKKKTFRILNYELIRIKWVGVQKSHLESKGLIQ